MGLMGSRLGPQTPAPSKQVHQDYNTLKGGLMGGNAQRDLDNRALSMQQLATQQTPEYQARNQAILDKRDSPTPQVQAQQSAMSLPQIQMPQIPQMQQFAASPIQQAQASQGGAPSPGLNASAQMYQPLVDLQGEAAAYRKNLQEGTGRIAGQIAGATGDWLAGMQNQSMMDVAQRGMGGSGVETQVRGQARDVATRAGAKQLGDLANQREAMLGQSISAALPITSAAPSLALQEKEVALGAQNQANQAAQLNYQNQLSSSNQAFNQYMALLAEQRQRAGSQVYTGFSV